VLGWFAVFGFRAISQTKAFLLQTRKEAWKELHSAILEYQSGIVADANQVQRLSRTFQAYNTSPQLLNKAIDEVTQWASNSPQASGANVLFLLENFETLFPETSSIRLQFANIDMLLQDRYSKARAGLLQQIISRAPPDAACEDALADAVNLHALAFDQVALLQDLLTFLHNGVFSSITKYTVPERVPVRENEVRLSLRKEDGKLHIVDGHGTVHDAPLTKTTPGPVRVDWTYC